MRGAKGGRKLLKRKAENRKSDVLKNKSIKDYMIGIRSKAKPQGGFYHRRNKFLLLWCLKPS